MEHKKEDGRGQETYVEECLEFDDVTVVGHPFSFRVAAVGLCYNMAEMTLQPVRFVGAGDNSEWREQRPEECAEGVEASGPNDEECAGEGNVRQGGKWEWKWK
jgi:hypothetical protein